MPFGPYESVTSYEFISPHLFDAGESETADRCLFILMKANIPMQNGGFRPGQ